MNKIDSAISELKEMDQLASEDSLIHRINPLAKLVVTLAYIIVVVSFGKYELSRIIIMAIYPMLMFMISGTSFKACLYKLRIVLPLVCAVGVFNPIFDREIMLYIGNVGISGGVISMLSLMLKGVFCVTASYLLIATTPFDGICSAFRKLKVPSFIVTLLLLTYRYISVMMEEISVMSAAYSLRAPGQKGIHISAWGSFLGQLLLRSMDRAEELYTSMQLRGFHGEFYFAGAKKWQSTDTFFMFVALGLVILFRVFNVSDFVGNIMVR